MCEEAAVLDAAHTSPSTSKTPPLRAPQALPPATVSIDNTSTASPPMLCGLPAMLRELSQRADITTGTIVESQHLPTAAVPRTPQLPGSDSRGTGGRHMLPPLPHSPSRPQVEPPSGATICAHPAHQGSTEHALAGWANKSVNLLLSRLCRLIPASPCTSRQEPLRHLRQLLC